MNWRKLVCFVKGHSLYGKNHLQRLKKEDVEGKQEEVVGGPRLTLRQSLQLNTPIISIRHDGSPRNTELHICRYCHGIVSVCELDHEYISKVDNYPEVAAMRDWFKQMEWEKSQHDHPAVKEAWDNYQMILKLSSDK